MTRIGTTWLCLCLVLGFTSLLNAQSSTATLSGTVRDQSGAVVPAAGVRLVGTATNTTSRTVSNEVGFYVFPGVVPGAYRLTVEASGMQKFEATLTVQVQQSAVVDVVLAVGADGHRRRSAGRDAAGDGGQPDAGPRAGAPAHRPIADQRARSSRLCCVPSRAWKGHIRAYGLRRGIARAGARRRGAQRAVGTGGNHAARPPGLDTIEEFKVENNNSSAKFSRPTTIVMSTRSGTNQLHGVGVRDAPQQRHLARRARAQDYLRQGAAI